MAYQVRQLNEKTGVTYVYEAVAVWNKELKQSRNKQVCIGKIDPATGKIIPSKRLSPQQAALRDPSVTATAQIVGPAVVLNELSKSTGLASLLKSCFPKTYRQILAMASYLALQGGALTHCSSWAKSHEPSLATSLSSQRITEIISSIGIDEKETFLAKWIKKALEDDYLCYDITSISSYSELNEFIKYGYNRDDEKLPQLNLAMLFGQKTALPLYYHRVPGSITDVSMLHNLVLTFKAVPQEIDELGAIRSTIITLKEASCQKIPQSKGLAEELLAAAGITLPSIIEARNVDVVTRKKLAIKSN